MKKNTSKRNAIVFILFCLVLGMLLGWIAKDLMGNRIIGAIITNMGVWVFISAIIAVYTTDAPKAALHVFVFFAGVIAAFYTHTALLGGEVTVRLILYWGVLALVGAAIGFLDWHSSNKEWVGAICGSVPVSLLLAEAAPIYQTRSVSLYFDAVCAVALYIILLSGKMKRLMALPFILIFTVALVYFDILSRVLGLVL